MAEVDLTVPRRSVDWYLEILVPYRILYLRSKFTAMDDAVPKAVLASHQRPRRFESLDMRK